jgi:hypothetical protein
MKIKFQILSLVCLFALVFAGPDNAQAQGYNIQTILSGGTNNIAANTLNTYGTSIPVVRGSTVALQASFKLVGSGTSGVNFLFNRSVDGVIWETNAITWTIAATATTTNAATTNITIGSTGFLMLNTSTNNNATATTNLLLKAGQKVGI